MSRTIRMPRMLYSRVVMAALLALVAACGDSSESVNAPRQVASVSLSPTATALVVGQTAAITAIARDAKGGAVEGRAVQWASSNAGVATVSSSGVVAAVAEGAATISAAVDGKVGQAQVTVAGVPVARVGLTPTGVVIEAGRTRQLTAVAFDAAGNVIEGRAVQWSTDSPAVATVSPSGLVQAVSPGYATITATIEGRS